ncbi:carboxy-S-adenosyl-L-methionine synthase CmoA [Alteromonas mediterranea]|uniref:carboxy-S-adenosyl-L-methionine synthase CmoA n=1 Tax=Alteromonas mediterranea TaxID=314275 RepID=UPI0003554AFC|nr:carboxy-S-adenosyl-L-methionine synthase CmoA [Alteromonas mediterranea]AGP85915.1 methyltransferase [Alteromonas mediterranea U4]AGP90047.1 methyltransferase [Alteromonas mediterranea U7]AGP93873.1 methyltransferase [Alteromonas mediterranea U8]
MKKHDNIYAKALNKVDDFKFDESVVDVFPDMIQRSVPGYETIVHTIGELAKSSVTPNSMVYDLGCSLGAASLSVSRAVSANTCEIFGVDASSAMVERCRRVVQTFTLPNPISIEQGLAQDVDINNASMVVMNFTLQFIPPSDREGLLASIYKGLNPGGILVLSEKVKHPTRSGNELLIDLHHQFKRDNGYSELEVSQKRAALEKVMLTDTFNEHETRLKKVGFADVVMWYKCYNFTSMVAIKA